MRRHLAALALLWLLLIFVGFGLRDPWPADEPRFAVVARDMVASGDWLFPRVGGDLYQDKPPLLFWLQATIYKLTRNLRVAFLLPSMLAALAVLLLVYDLARRWHGPAPAFAAAATLACTLQFVQVFRGAQIDPTLCALATLSLYGLARHLLSGPAWGWYAAGGFAAGLGVITKGVGFLPLLLLLPWAALRGRLALPKFDWGARALLAPASFLLAVSIWLVPMLLAVAARGNPALTAYRDEILFQQTVARYAESWHHLRPWYYFLTDVIPLLWLPFSALLFWLAPRWRDDWRERNAKTLLPLAWVLIVIVFFSLSPGKRGVYVLLALPALALAAAPHLPSIYALAKLQRVVLVAAGLLTMVAILAAGLLWMGDARALATLELSGIQPGAVYALAGAMLLAWFLAARTRAVFAWPAVLAAAVTVFGVWIAPHMNADRSSARFMSEVQSQVRRDETLGMMSYKEQFLLQLERPAVNFGHRRWREGPTEAFDAALWLAAAPQRVLLVPEESLQPCFAIPSVSSTALKRGGDEHWFLVRGKPSPDCVLQGDSSRAIFTKQ